MNVGKTIGVVAATVAAGFSMVACFGQTDAERLKTAVEAANHFVSTGADLRQLLHLAIESGETFDVQIIECEGAPLRATGGKIPPYELTRGDFSPSSQDREKDAATWRFDDAGSFEEKVVMEAKKTQCRLTIFTYAKGWTAFGFTAQLDGDAALKQVGRVHNRGVF
jgi:hypothetical protein